jgi:hypothetical protein
MVGIIKKNRENIMFFRVHEKKMQATTDPVGKKSTGHNRTKATVSLEVEVPSASLMRGEGIEGRKRHHHWCRLCRARALRHVHVRQ